MSGSYEELPPEEQQGEEQAAAQELPPGQQPPPDEYVGPKPLTDADVYPDPSTSNIQMTHVSATEEEQMAAATEPEVEAVEGEEPKPKVEINEQGGKGLPL